MSISQLVGQVTNPYPPPDPPPAPPPPPSGTLIWSGDLDTGDETQFTAYIRNAADRWRVTTADAGVTPRQGTHMARVECRQGEPTSWDGGLSATLAIKTSLGVGYNQTYTDSYVGWSAWIPSDWPWAANAPAGMNSIFMEWHGHGPMQQAPFHWGINPFTGRFYIDLHRDASGWNPYMSQQFEYLSDPGVANSWHDYVVRIKWSMGTDGVVQFWRDGVKQGNDYNGPTAPITGEAIKLQPGIYTANVAPATKHIYLDEIKVGTNYSSVTPG